MEKEELSESDDDDDTEDPHPAHRSAMLRTHAASAAALEDGSSDEDEGETDDEGESDDEVSGVGGGGETLRAIPERCIS